MGFRPGPSGIGCHKLSSHVAATADPSATNTFVPVHVTADAAAPVVEIVLAGGEHIHVRPGASPDLVQAVVTAVRAACGRTSAYLGDLIPPSSIRSLSHAPGMVWRVGEEHV